MKNKTFFLFYFFFGGGAPAPQNRARYAHVGRSVQSIVLPFGLSNTPLTVSGGHGALSKPYLCKPEINAACRAFPCARDAQTKPSGPKP